MTIAITKGSKGVGEWCDQRSPLRNPFSLIHAKYRDAVCDAYAEYFEAMLNRDFSTVGAVVKMACAIAWKYDVPISYKFKMPIAPKFCQALVQLQKKGVSQFSVNCKTYS